MPRQDDGWYIHQSPQDFIVVGSNDGVTWNELLRMVDVVGWTADAVTFSFPVVGPYYSYYRLAANRLAGGGHDALAVQELRIHGYYAPTASPTAAPSIKPSFRPTRSPTRVPTVVPTKAPTLQSYFYKVQFCKERPCRN